MLDDDAEKGFSKCVYNEVKYMSSSNRKHEDVKKKSMIRLGDEMAFEHLRAWAAWQFFRFIGIFDEEKEKV